MARRPCRRSEPSSSDAEEVSVFDRSGHGNITMVDKEMEPSTLSPPNSIVILNASWLHCGSKSHIHVNVMMSSAQIKCNQNSHKHAGEHTLQLVLTTTVKESWPAKCTACQYACVSYSDSKQSSL